MLLIPDRAEDITYLRFPVPENKGTIEKHDGFSIIFIGRCTREKGYNVLPEIAKAFIEGGQKVFWHIVGEIDEKTKTQYLWPDGANVRFYGSVNNDAVKKLLCRIHLILLPSLAEGMPVAVIEAMKAEVIPIVNKIESGISELVENGVTGFTIESNSIEQYKDKIIYLIKNPAEQFRLRENARDYANINFDPLANTKNYENKITEAGSKLKTKKANKIYGSRLDQYWMPNSITKTLRSFNG